MSIWINQKLASHNYEKTLVAASKNGGDNLIIWIDGTKTELSFHKKDNGDINPNPFGMCDGAINTNAGVGFTKEMLLEIANKMKDGAILKVAACNKLNLNDVSTEFNHDNDMVQIGDYTFAPSNHPDVIKLKAK
jgi:hypothetical protein